MKAWNGLSGLVGGAVGAGANMLLPGSGGVASGITNKLIG